MQEDLCVLKFTGSGRSLPVELADGVGQERVQFPSPRLNRTEGIFTYCSKNGFSLEFVTFLFFISKFKNTILMILSTRN